MPDALGTLRLAVPLAPLAVPNAPQLPISIILELFNLPGGYVWKPLTTVPTLLVFAPFGPIMPIAILSEKLHLMQTLTSMLHKAPFRLPVYV